MKFYSYYILGYTFNVCTYLALLSAFFSSFLSNIFYSFYFSYHRFIQGIKRKVLHKMNSVCSRGIKALALHFWKVSLIIHPKVMMIQIQKLYLIKWKKFFMVSRWRRMYVVQRVVIKWAGKLRVQANIRHALMLQRSTYLTIATRYFI